MNATLEIDLTLKAGQRIITTETHRTGRISLCPNDSTIENNRSVLILFDDCQTGWVHPTHLRNYTDN